MAELNGLPGTPPAPALVARFFDGFDFNQSARLRFVYILPLARGPMPNGHTCQCSRFCFEQAVSCLRLALLNFSPEHRGMFIRMSDEWKRYAQRCGGRRELWMSWCERETESVGKLSCGEATPDGMAV